MNKELKNWNYGDGEFCYGEEVVYQKAAAFLGDSCEDWGCGTAWAKRYFKNYRGIDGSKSLYMDEIADLRNYTSKADNILLRQVLDCSEDWRMILENAKHSFQKKLCITIHTPLQEKTGVIFVDPVSGIPDVGFNMDDILDYFKDCKVSTEMVMTKFEYGTEILIYIEK